MTFASVCPSRIARQRFEIDSEQLAALTALQRQGVPEEFLPQQC
jgi:hypothetical protein